MFIGISCIWPIFIAILIVGSSFNDTFIVIKKIFVHNFLLLFLPYLAIPILSLIFTFSWRARIVSIIICVLTGITTFILYDNYINPY